MPNLKRMKRLVRWCREKNNFIVEIPHIILAVRIGGAGRRVHQIVDVVTHGKCNHAPKWSVNGHGMVRGVLRKRAIRGGHNKISFSTFMSATFIPKRGMEPVGSSVWVTDWLTH